jgi:serine/threonine protein phosphatase PrpC
MLRVVEEAARTDTGRQRHANEDSYLARSPVFVVADGMGGAQAGEVASRIAAESFEEGLGDGAPEQELSRAALTANRRIFDLAREDSSRSGMGTTLTGALVSEDEVSIVHVGDSRAYLYRDGTLRQLTRDHSLVEELRRQGQLTSEEAEEHPQRSIITRALGPEPDVELDVHTHQARPGDVFLLCSDGLTGMVREDRVREILSSSSDLRAAADRLVREANEMGGRDNITVVCFRLGGTPVGEAPDDTGDLGDTMVGLSAADVHGDEVAASEARPEAADERPEPARRPRDPARRRRRVIVTAVLIGVAVLLVAGAIGARAALRNVYFVGQDHGLVTMYRGVPYELPGGISLYDTRYVSSVPVARLSPVERRRLLDHKLRSHDDASDVVRRLERSRTP